MGRSVRGEVRPPGDKSISHRALLLGALARGTSVVAGLNPGADVASSAQVVSSLGVTIVHPGETTYVEGRGGEISAPGAPLDCGNSGTTMRLVSGWLAAMPVRATLMGDASLSSRPMERIAEPLRRMGARIATTDGHAPIRIEGTEGLHGIAHESAVASAQVKSAILIAGLFARGRTEVTEPVRSRDHTERMLGAMGARIGVAGTTVSVERGAELAPLEMDIPGDPSAAAFYLAAAAIVPGSRLVVRGVSTNPTRTGFLDVLSRMGARLSVTPRGGTTEPLGDIELEAAELTGTTIGPDEVPAVIDEIPVLAVIAACATSPTRITGAGELRHKECDRLAALAEGLGALGADIEERPDGLVIRGGGFSRGARVRTHGDHRIAMSMAVAALAAPERVEIDEDHVHAVSDPDFPAALARLRGARELPARVGERSGAVVRADAERCMTRRLRVAIDGPSASGKTTTARAVAERLGYRYLDSGALYRALALALSRRGVDPDDLSSVMAVAGSVDAGYDGDGSVRLDGETIESEIRTQEVAELASRVSVHAPVREWVNDRLRREAMAGGVVMEGRDIGTVVLPDAEVKVFLEAELTVRARRRHQDLVTTGQDEPLDKVQHDLETRDRRDTGRLEAPLEAAPGAVRIDGSTLTFEEQVAAVLRAVDACA